MGGVQERRPGHVWTVLAPPAAVAHLLAATADVRHSQTRHSQLISTSFQCMRAAPPTLNRVQRWKPCAAGKARNYMRCCAKRRCYGT